MRTAYCGSGNGGVFRIENSGTTNFHSTTSFFYDNKAYNSAGGMMYVTGQNTIIRVSGNGASLAH